MFRGIFTILLLLPLLAFTQQPCFTLDEGKGISLFSPFLGSNPRLQQEHAAFSFGDTSRALSCNGIRKKSVIGVYDIPTPEPVFAAHSGKVSVYTSVNASEGNQANDALWIDGGTITTNYIGLIPTVQTGQYVYAGQLLGNIYRDKFASIFGFGIRRAPAHNPIHKRGYLPTVAESNCECSREPVWPEYFVNPGSKFIAYDHYNDFLPEASLNVTIEPGGIGKWSFDNGVTWLNSGDRVDGLPFGYYKIIFKPEYGYTAPLSIQTKTTHTSKNFSATVHYTPDYTIIEKPRALLLRENDQKIVEEKVEHALDSINTLLYASNQTTLLKNSIIDSLNERFTKIEAIQKETFFFTKLFKYILPILALAMLFTLILLVQNKKIRRQKKYLENLQKEQHHRVHNSLALVSSLLNKYKHTINAEKLADIDNSIIAISTVHRQLYKDSDLEHVNFQPIAEHIVHSLLTQQEMATSIEAGIAADVIIAQQQSTTLALIFNELVTNSIKYAFRQQKNGKITLVVTQQKHQLLLEYCDNGTGYPAGFLKKKTPGFGRVMLEGLAKQLRGKIVFYNKGGACCTLKI